MKFKPVIDFGNLRNALARTAASKARTGVGYMSPCEVVPIDSFRPQTYTLPQDLARSMAKDWFKKFPKQAQDTKVESSRATADGQIDFTMGRLPRED